MKIAGSHSVPGAPDRVYALLQDPEVLAGAMPGCDSLVRIGPGEYQMKMKMSLAAISGLFDGKVKITDPSPPASFRLIVEGAGKIGFLKGEGLLTLKAQGDATAVAFDGDVHVGGTIAAVGQRLLDTTARMMIQRFFDNLATAAAERA